MQKDQILKGSIISDKYIRRWKFMHVLMYYGKFFCSDTSDYEFPHLM
jgi:hypothetical protein